MQHETIDISTKENCSDENQNQIPKKRGRPRKIRLESDIPPFKPTLCNEIKFGIQGRLTKRPSSIGMRISCDYPPITANNQNQIVTPTGEDFFPWDHNFTDLKVNPFPVVKKLDLNDVLSKHQIAKMDCYVKKEMKRDYLRLKQYIKNHYRDDEICNILVSYIMENTFHDVVCANQEHLSIHYTGNLPYEDVAAKQKTIDEYKKFKENLHKSNIAKIKSAIIPPLPAKKKVGEVISAEPNSVGKKEGEIISATKAETIQSQKSSPKLSSPKKENNTELPVTKSDLFSAPPKKSNEISCLNVSTANPNGIYFQYPYQREAIGSYYYNYPRVFLNTMVNNSCFPPGYFYPPHFNMLPYPAICPPFANQPNYLQKKRERKEDQEENQNNGEGKFPNGEVSFNAKSVQDNGIKENKTIDIDDIFSFPEHKNISEKKVISVEDSPTFGGNDVVPASAEVLSKDCDKIDEIINLIQQLDREKKMLDLDSLSKLKSLISEEAFIKFKKCLFEHGRDCTNNDMVTIQLYENEKSVLRVSYNPISGIFSMSKSKKLSHKTKKTK